MSESPYVITVTAQNFAEVVLRGSQSRPVLVDFWAAWCAPCRMLMPLLEKLANEYQGQFIVAKVNSDEQQQLAQQYGVRSLPTVKVFRNGQVVDEFVGAQGEGTIRALLERHIVRESDRVHQSALQALETGDVSRALALLEQAHAMDPQRAPIALDLARLLAEQGQTERAEGILNALPESARTSAEVAGLLAQLEFYREASALPETAELEAAVAADPKDYQALYNLAVARIVEGDYTGAMDNLLTLMQRARSFKDDLARKTLLKLFDMLGDDPAVATYRRKMFALLH